MVITELTKELIEAGKKLIEELDSAKINVKAALWIYSQDTESWKLIIAIPGIDETGPRSAYRKIQQILTKTENLDELSLEDIVIVSPKKFDLLSFLRSVFKTGKKVSHIRLSNVIINGILIPDLLIYRLL